MDQIPTVMDKHLEVVQCHSDGGLLLGASSLTGRFWYGSLWYYATPGLAPDVEKCTAGVQLEAGLSDACWLDNTKVLVGLDTGGVALWELMDDFHTFLQQSAALEHDGIVSAVCPCAGATRAVSASYDRCIKIWDVQTFSSTHTYRAHSGSIRSIQCHPTEPDIFLSAADDGWLFLWDVRREKPVRKIDKSPLQGLPTCVDWQPGSGHVFGAGTESGEVIVKDSRAAVPTSVSFLPHKRSVTRLRFSPLRTSQLATVSEDCTVVVTDVSDDKSQQIYCSASHGDFVQGVSWGGDGRLYTCGWDGQVWPHTVTTPDNQTVIEPEPVNMEVNGFAPDNENGQDGAPHMEKVPCKDCGDSVHLDLDTPQSEPLLPPQT